MANANTELLDSFYGEDETIGILVVDADEPD
jgi:hypothetical protein